MSAPELNAAPFLIHVNPRSSVVNSPLYSHGQPHTIHSQQAPKCAHLTELTPIFPITCKISPQNKSYLSPMFSASSALFRAFSGLAFLPNPFISCALRTSRVDH